MQALAKTALIYGIKALIGKTDWNRVLECVVALADSTLEGSEKRQAAVDMVRAIGVDIKNNLLNIAIEIAVLAVRGVK
jgi:hypothetical protein